MEDLHLWYELTEKLKLIKKQEMELRKRIFATNFPDPDEGTNCIEINGGELVANYPYKYTLDQNLLEAGLEHIPATKREKLIVWKPTMVKGVYNNLTAKARKEFTAECITITPGTPSLKIVPTEPGL